MKKYLFIDRDGTLVYEPEDYQVDALDKVKFLPHVIPALLRLQEAGYSLVMVSNQDGLGTQSFPLETFTPAHELILHTLESQGINFEQVLICPHKPEDNCDCRKPKLGLVQAYLNDDSWDRANSYFIGDRPTDLAMAAAMGIKGLKVGDFGAAGDSDAAGGSGAAVGTTDAVAPLTWDEIVVTILKVGPVHTKHARTAHVVRNTRETKIDLTVDLDHNGNSSIHTGIGFFDHMLDQIATHGNFNLTVKVAGDLEVDGHHTIEDTGIALGTALKEALGDKRGIGRFGFVVPMDEVMAQVFATSTDKGAAGSDQVVSIGADTKVGPEAASDSEAHHITVALDISGRPHCEFELDANFTREDINGFETQMVSHFFESLAVAMGLTLHMKVTQGNAHHQVEALFKAFGRALRPALKVVGTELPSSKGTL